MILNKIQTNNFRNLNDIEMTPGSRFNLVIGKNAQGKSNFIESVYILSLGKSNRTNREDDLINFNSGSASITGNFSSKSQEFNLGILWEKERGSGIKKTIHFNGNPLHKLSDFLDKAPMVIMTTDDLDLIRGKPDNRRKLLDLLCCRLHPPHVAVLRDYRKILEARNQWLKLPPSQQDPGLAEIYDNKLSELGASIIYRRIQVIDFLKPLLNNLYREVFGDEMPELRYRTSIKNLKGKTQGHINEAFMETIRHLTREEKRRRHTLMGPHRDDFDFRQKGKSMKIFSSFGQIREAAVILKLAEIQIISEKVGKNPILLIDDCLHEFDREHIGKFFSFLDGKHQIFYASTTVHPHFDTIADINGFLMEGGTIKPWNLSSLKKV